VRTGLIWTACIVAMTLAAAPQQAGGVGVVRVRAVDKSVVAVPNATEEGHLVGSALAKELSDTLRFDLDNCGYYTVVADARAVADAERRDLEAGKVLLPSWQALDAELVFKTDFRRQGDRLVISCDAYDTGTGKRVLGRTVKGTEEERRRLVHALSDEIVKVLVGAEGFATTRIAFIKNNPDGGKDLYLIDYDGHNLRRVTHDRTVAVSPDWSPDGKQIYYTSTHKGEPNLYRIDMTKGQRVLVASYPGLNYAAAPSPDGKKLALVLSKSGTPDIYTMDTDGQDLVRLTRSIGRLSTCPVWSHDGRRIAYVSDVEGGPQLYVMRADGSQQQRLLTGYRTMSSLDWSPAAATADLVVFSAKVGGRFQLFVADLRRGVVNQLTFDAADHQDPNFAPDGRHIIYVREARYGAADLYMLDVLDPKPVQITRLEGNEFYPAWSPVGY
jgi:TolB protein